jgi:mannitol 2-dehydrogenase
MPRLSQRTLGSLHPEVAVPTYDRASLTTGVVHIGVGGFHRAHQAMYLDRLLGQGGDPSWSVCGVGTLPSDLTMQRALKPQDHLYTLVLKGTDGSVRPRVVGSISRYLHAPTDPEAVVARLTEPATRIVSLTITEGGYHVSDTTGEFEVSRDIAADLEPGAVPRTVFGLVTEALDRRRRAGTAGFTVVSCDNMPGNGGVARRSFVSFAELKNPELARWIDQNVTFPSSMVDRITPITSDQDRRDLSERFDVQDAWPVVAEPFVQWVLEDRFVDDRPPLEDVGVQLVDDVQPYELMKLRLLNGSHQVLGYLGYLAGYRFVHEVCLDPAFARLLLRYMTDEATPTLPPLPGIDLEDYRRTLLGRFANPNIRDTLARNCTDGSDRIPKFVLPVVRDQLRAGGDISVAITAVAAWARYLEGVDEQGHSYPVQDRRWQQLSPLAARQRIQPDALLSLDDVFRDLAAHPRFVAAYLEAMRALHEDGARSVVRALTTAV